MNETIKNVKLHCRQLESDQELIKEVDNTGHLRQLLSQTNIFLRFSFDMVR